MQKKPEVKLFKDDYVQSANTLFHFVSREEYLQDILVNQALVPRYCVEDVGYLHLNSEGTTYGEIAILQKCFCDIPFHKLKDKSQLQVIDDPKHKLTKKERTDVLEHNTHPDLYGEFAIAFSKTWGERNHLFPIQYVNENSDYINDFAKAFSAMTEVDDLSAVFTNDMFNRLAYIKPLRGTMNRTLKREKTGEKITYKIKKNFHDEREWRYVPKADSVKECKLTSVIANPCLFEPGFINAINEALETEQYQQIWLHYNYDDVRYIIVPDPLHRMEIIDTILSIPDNVFGDAEQANRGKLVLVSKILVLSEIGRDW